MSEPLTVKWTIAFDPPDSDGWVVARVIEKPSAVSQGRTRAQARENIRDALREVLREEAQPPASEKFDDTEPLELVIRP